MAVYVAIDSETKEKLLDLARRERRSPADQAALMIEQALRDYDPKPPEPKRAPVPA